ncbi:MAG: hypothetical protein NT159_05950 [Proteobacteria bacterium]|nr:hypothetical protein [Pseudomonadota bacterium]
MFLIVYGEHRLLEGAPLDTGQKFGKFGTGGQEISSIAVSAKK